MWISFYADLPRLFAPVYRPTQDDVLRCVIGIHQLPMRVDNFVNT